MYSTVVAYILIGCFFWIEARLRKGQEAKSFVEGEADQGSTRVVGAAFGISILFVLVGPVLNYLQIGRMTDSIGWFGIAIMLAGIVVRAWANQTLGQFYTRTLRIQTDQRIIDQGPYKVIRHPGYLGTILLWIGAGLATVNWIALVVIMVLMILAYAYRVQSEEAMLMSSFGEEYKQYMARTRKLIPFIY